MRNINIIFAILFSSLGLMSQSDFSLDQAIQYALQHHDDIRIKNIEVAEADSRVDELKAIGLPKVDGYLNYQYFVKLPTQAVDDFITPAVINVLNQNMVTQDPIPFPEAQAFPISFFRKQNLEAGIDASMLLFDGSYLVALEAAKLYKESIKDQIDLTEQTIKANVTKAYLNILIAEKNKEILDNNILNLKSSLDEVTAIYEEGFVEQLDVSRIQLSYQNLTNQSQELEQLIKLSYNLLKFQMHYPLSKDIGITEDIETLVQRLQVLQVDTEESIDYNNRAEYGQLEMGQELNALDLKRNKRGYLPSVLLFAGLSESLQRDRLFDSEEPTWLPSFAVGARVNVPIFDGFEKKEKIQQIKLKLDKLQIEKEKFERAVDLQVTNARINVINAKNSLANAESSLSLVEDIYDKTQIKFREGVGSSVELIQAESSLFQTQGAYIKALYNLLNAKTDLDIALGKI